MTTLGPLLRHVRTSLEQAGKPEAALDARLLVEHFTGTDRADAITDPQRSVSEEHAEAVLAALARRIGGEPVHRIVGAREFYGMRLTLSPGTLEPRPDTDALVDLIVEKPHSCYVGDHRTRHDWGYGCGKCPACELRAKGYRKWRERQG